jgi:glycosyltransferase involved in cell wall biosynthesis
MIDLSVIIPAKNESCFIGLSIDSLKMSLKKWGGNSEIILVDNGSSDSTKEIASTMGCIVLSDHEGNIGRLRNVGAHHSSGKIIVFLDADCIVAPDWALFCLENFNNPEIGGVGTRAIPDLNNATWVEKSVNKLMAGAKRPDFVQWLGTSNLFVRRDLFFLVNGFDEKLETGEDVNFCKKLNKNYLFCLEKRTDTIHLRESKTLTELFRREFWRGKSSIRSLVESKFDYSEIPSVLVPAINLILMCVILLGGLGLVSGECVSVAIVFFFILPLLFIIKKRIEFRFSFNIVQYYIISFTYIFARSSSLMVEFLSIIREND